MTAQKDLVPITIDLTTDDILNESWLHMFGTGVKTILGAMFGGLSLPVYVKGHKSDVSSFAKTLGSEKRYLEAAAEFGLDDPQTFRSKAQLDSAVKNFERKTGIQWPFE
jgi:hypothetical protein